MATQQTTVELCRATARLSGHEKRRGAHPRLPSYSDDLLHSLAYWRRVRRTCSHAAAQYAAHRAVAFGGAP